MYFLILPHGLKLHCFYFEGAFIYVHDDAILQVQQQVNVIGWRLALQNVCSR